MGSPGGRAAAATTLEARFARRLAAWRQNRVLARISVSWLEDVAVVVVAALFALRAEWRIVSAPSVFQTDALIHEFWMRRFQDPDLFQDPLTTALLDTGYQPAGFRLLYWLASQVVDPVFFGELLPLVLQPFAVWLVFRIVREHSPWWPAAWIGAALFLVPWEIHRFSGGHPRAFAQPVVLLTVFLLLRRRDVAAAAVPPLGALIYPPASLVALAVVGLAALARGKRFFLDQRRAIWAAASAAAFVAITLGTRLTAGSPDLISEAEAHRYPEFGPGGQMHFFADSTLEYLRQNYSGFFLETSGSILAVSALLLLLLRPRNAILLRWEVWSMAIAGLVLFAVAHLLLFRLYLPHRYTYPLLPFFCILIAVALRPTLASYGSRARPLLLLSPLVPLAFAGLALVVFPLGPTFSTSRFGSWLVDSAWYLVAGLAVAAVLGLLLMREPGKRTMAAAAIAATGVGCILVAEVTFAGGGRSPGASTCGEHGLYRYLSTLPHDSVIGGDPRDLGCIPIAARRPVVISRKLYQPWEREYFGIIRPRMFATVDALYGPSRAAIVALRSRYGADYLLVRKSLPRRPPAGMAPFTDRARQLARTGQVRAVEQLPSACMTWQRGGFAVYELACVAEASAT